MVGYMPSEKAEGKSTHFKKQKTYGIYHHIACTKILLLGVVI
jgi:hypothetical protein